jgi:4-amino-4-deoxy-L-arabinose transferase-like glycosyltransferase
LSAITERQWVLLLGLVCAVILFSHLGGTALFEPDEGRNAEKAREILLTGDWITPHEDFLPILDKPMAFYWLVAASLKLFGVSEWSARLPSAIAAAGCFILVYLFARRRWGVWEALWSSLVLATSFEFFVFARLVIFDMTLTFFITLALVSFDRLARQDSGAGGWRYSLTMYAAMAIGTLIKGPIAVVIPGMVIFFYLLLSRQWFLLRQMQLLPGVLVYCAIVMPWYIVVDLRNPGYLRYFLWEEHVIRYVTPHFGRTKSWYYFFMVLGAGFLPWTLLLPLTGIASWRRWRENDTLLLLLWAILPFIFFSASRAKLPHYILPIFPALALLTGRAVANYLKEHEARRLWIVYLVWLLPVGFLGYLLAGAASPGILPHQIRSSVMENLSAILAYGILLVFIFGSFIPGSKRGIFPQLGGSYVCTAVGLAVFLVALSQLVIDAPFRRASKVLARQTLPQIGPNDRVIFYNSYLEGVPFYLRIQEPILLVQANTKTDVLGSFYLGERRQGLRSGADQVLFTFEEFAELWKRNDSRLWIFLNNRNIDRLQRNVQRQARIFANHEDYYVFTNRP